MPDYTNFDDQNPEPRKSARRSRANRAGPSSKKKERASMPASPEQRAHAIEVAKKLAALGLYVFPCALDKGPAWNCKWRDESTKDASKVAAIFGQYGDAAMVGIDCGRSGIVVVDGDRPTTLRPDCPDGVGYLRQIVHKIMEETGEDVVGLAPRVTTPGKGLHFFYTNPGNNIGCPWPAGPDGARVGVEIKGSGGYVVAIGSRRDDGVYEQDPYAPDLLEALEAGTLPELPESLLKALCPGRTMKRGRPGSEGYDEKDYLPERMRSDLIADCLQLLPNGEDSPWFDTYESWIAIGMSISGATRHSEDGRELWVDWSNQRPQEKYDPSSKWDTFESKGRGAGGIREALERVGVTRETHPALWRRLDAAHGWWIFREDGADPDPDADLDYSEKAEERAEKAKKEGSKPKTIAELIDDALLELRGARDEPGHAEHTASGGDKGFEQLTEEVLGKPSLLPPLLDRRFVKGVRHGIAAAPGVGKSTLIDLEAVAFAANRPELVGEPEFDFPGAYIIVSNEDGASVVKRRIKTNFTKNNIPLKTGESIFVWANDPITLISEADGKAGPTMEAVQVIRKLADIRRKMPIAHIVIDTLASAQSGVDETLVSKMGPMMDLLLRVARAGFAAVTVVTHLRKEGQEKANSVWGPAHPSLADLRGSTLIAGSIRHVMILDRPSQEDGEKYGFNDREARHFVAIEGVKCNEGTGAQRAERRLYKYSTTQVLGQDVRDPDSLKTMRVSVLELACASEAQAAAQETLNAAAEAEEQQALFALVAAHDELQQVGKAVLRGSLTSGAGGTTGQTSFRIVNEHLGLKKNTDAKGRKLVQRLLDRRLIEEYPAVHCKVTVPAVRPTAEGRKMAAAPPDKT